ncbi:MAG: hypothetical protein LBP55_01020 [Candidatus Adiutrix sp.]|jgi:chromosome segregation ATPase|nr:hypothetical protein [Candidatus Adiutrix sp.]
MNQTKFETLERLDRQVSAMLDKVASLTAQKEGLEADLQATREKLAGTQRDLEATEGLLNEMQSERDDILARVEAILGRLA